MLQKKITETSTTTTPAPSRLEQMPGSSSMNRDNLTNQNNYLMEEEDDEEEQLYVVEKIIKKRVYQGKVQYFVKWLDYSSKSNTWEPLNNLNTIPNMIYQFEYGLPQTGRLVESDGEGEEEGDEFDKYKPSSEDIERIFGHDVIDGKLKYLVSFKNWTELDWRNKVEIPKKKLDEYNRYLKDGVVPQSYKNNNSSNHNNSTSTNNNTASTTTTSAGSGNKKQTSFEPEEEETTVKLEEIEQQPEEESVNNPLKSKDSNSASATQNIWQTQNNTSKTATTSSALKSKKPITSRLNNLNSLSNALEKLSDKVSRKEKLDRILEPIPIKKPILKKNNQSNTKKLVAFADNQEEKIKKPNKSLTKRQPPVSQLKSSSAALTHLKEKTQSLLNKESTVSSSVVTPGTTTKNQPASTVNTNGGVDQGNLNNKQSTQSVNNITSSFDDTSKTKNASGNSKQLDIKPNNIDRKPQLPLPAVTKKNQGQMTKSSQKPQFEKQQEVMQQQQQQQQQQSQIGQMQDEQQIQQQQLQPQLYLEMKQEKIVELTEGSFEAGDCEHKVTIRSLERELEDMIFEVFWKPRADGVCPRSKLVKYADLKKHAPYKLIYWLEVMVRNSVQELEANEVKFNQIMHQQQIQQQQQLHQHQHQHVGYQI